MLLYKVLYTHQKAKKRKTWQDGFLEFNPSGRKANLLSEERKPLDSIYAGREKIHPDAELESEKYLIQVEDLMTDTKQPVTQNSYQPFSQSLPPSIQRVTVKRQGLSAARGRRQAFVPPRMYQQKRDEILSIANNKPAEVINHPSLHTNNSMCSTYKPGSDENQTKTFHNLYQNVTPELGNHNQQTLFSVQEDDQTVANYGMSKQDAKVSGINDQHRLENCRFAEVLDRAFKEPENKGDCREVTARAPSSKPTVENSAQGKKRSASEILALFSKRSKTCYKNTETISKTEDVQRISYGLGNCQEVMENQQQATSLYTEDHRVKAMRYEQQEENVASVKNDFINAGLKETITHRQKSSMKNVLSNGNQEYPKQHEDVGISSSISTVNNAPFLCEQIKCEEEYPNSHVQMHGYQEEDQFWSTSKEPKSHDLLHEQAGICDKTNGESQTKNLNNCMRERNGFKEQMPFSEEFDDSFDFEGDNEDQNNFVFELPHGQSSTVSSGRSNLYDKEYIVRNDLAIDINRDRPIAITSNDFIHPFQRDKKTLLSTGVSEHPGSLSPYQGLSHTHGAKDKDKPNLHGSENASVTDGILSPVYNPDLEANKNDKMVHLASPAQVSTCLMRGAVTSSMVRKNEPMQKMDHTDAAGRSSFDRFVTEDCYQNEISSMEYQTGFNKHGLSSVVSAGSNCHGFDRRIPTAITQTGISCSPSEISVEPTQTKSPFGYVPTQSIIIQEDELTMYSDGEVNSKSFNEENHCESGQTSNRRVGFLEGSMMTGKDQFIQGFNDEQSFAVCGRKKSFKPVYSSLVPKNRTHDSAKGSSYGELYFPTTLDCDQSLTPTRNIKIPIEFQSLAEYRTVFQAVLREHLNIILYELAKKYHSSLKKANIDLEFEKTDAKSKSENGPSCNHGACKLRSVRKEGPNKGKLFYCCPETSDKQCKFFIWAEEYQKKSGSSSDQMKTEHRVNLSDVNSVNTFFKGQSLSFYCGCIFLKKSRSSYENGSFRGKGHKWSRPRRPSLDEFNTVRKTLYLSLPFKAGSSTYSKDDIWIISKNFNFEQGKTFIAKSTFYGPTSSGEVQISAVSCYSPSNWQSGETVHALLACNAGTELTCINNLDEIRSNNDVPILPHLILRQDENQKPRTLCTSKFISPALKSSQDTISLSEADLVHLIEDSVDKYTLNEDQTKALRAIAFMFMKTENSTDKNRATLIHGVFGAGKSFLLSVVIIFLVDLLKRDEKSDWKILISSTTNVAVDRVLQGLLDLGFDDFVRVGSIKKIAKPVLPYSVHATGSDDQELKELQNMLKSDLRPAEKVFVRKSIEKHRLGLNRKKMWEVPVVGVTCAASVFPCMDKLSFKIHLLDECSQMTEPMSLLPIARFKCEKLILVGDPKQLSPTIQGSESDHKFGLERTLFDRLQQKGHEPIILRTQYRCHPLISAIPNELFYNGKLIDGITVEERSPMIDWLPTLCFYNIMKGREKCGNDGSYYNEEEAKFVVFLINAMLLFRIEPTHIGVITQYKSQVWKISNLLQEESSTITTSQLRSIQISTVDAFQGAEKEIIILSCVRTDHVGFIDCDRRTNVALSRAKRHLLIAGNLKMLLKNTLWSNIIECCERIKGGVTSSKAFIESVEPKIEEQKELLEKENVDVKKKNRRRNTSSQSSQKEKKKELKESEINTRTVPGMTETSQNETPKDENNEVQLANPIEIEDTEAAISDETEHSQNILVPSTNLFRKSPSTKSCSLDTEINNDCCIIDEDIDLPSSFDLL